MNESVRYLLCPRWKGRHDSFGRKIESWLSKNRIGETRIFMNSISSFIKNALAQALSCCLPQLVLPCADFLLARISLVALAKAVFTKAWSCKRQARQLTFTHPVLVRVKLMT